MRPAAILLALICAGSGVLLLHSSWTRRAGGWRLAAGWALAACGVLGWRLTGVGWDKAWTYALLALCLTPLPFLVRQAEWKDARVKHPRRAETEPPPYDPSRTWRAVARTLLAGPLAGIAALGLAAALALHGPGDDGDRLVAAGFLFPIAWAAAGVWATTDGRLVRIALGLAGLAAAGFGAAVL